MAEKDEGKYLVLKWEHLFNIAEKDDSFKVSLNHITYVYEQWHKLHEYIIVNQDEGYADEIWDLILKREREK